MTTRAIIFDYFQKSLDFTKIPPYIVVCYDRHLFGEKMKYKR
jgi:hypothetical protein